MRSGVSERDFAVLAMQEAQREVAQVQVALTDALVVLARDGAGVVSLATAQDLVASAVRRFGEAVLALSRGSEALARAREDLGREDEA